VASVDAGLPVGIVATTSYSKSESSLSDTGKKYWWL
jgi:hypothetical protein